MIIRYVEHATKHGEYTTPPRWQPDLKAAVPRQK
jgi:hypothetical protein